MDLKIPEANYDEFLPGIDVGKGKIAVFVHRPDPSFRFQLSVESAQSVREKKRREKLSRQGVSGGEP